VSAGTNDATGGRRRVPAQERSRRRVEAILDAAGRLVARDGVASLSTRSIASEAGMPVASLYQYYADKESILLEMISRDMAEMDAQVTADLGRLETVDLVSVVETTMRAFVKVYHRRPEFVEIWLRGRTNPAIREAGRQHNVEVARMLRDFAVEAGLVADTLPPVVAQLAVEVGDRVFQLAFEHTDAGDEDVIEEGMAMVTAYLERYVAHG
jgi:AcrR family transcriptional regulator